MNSVSGASAKSSPSIIAGLHSRWHWTFGLNTAVPKGFPLHGAVNTIEEAKAIIEAAWKDWLTAAGLNEYRDVRE